MKTNQEIFDMLKKTDLLFSKSQKEMDKLKLKNLMNNTLEEKRKLFFNDVLPMFVAVNVLTDRKATLLWALGETELTAEVNRLSKVSFAMVKEHLGLFDKFL